jgi:LysM repeat protein
MSVRVPKGQGDGIVTALLALPERDKQRAMRVAKAVHTAPTKQKLVDVAKKHGVPVELVAARNGLAKDHVLARGARIVIPPPQPKTSLLPEARAMPLPTMIEAPVLLADATELLPEAVPAPKKKHGLHAEPLLTGSALKGTVELVRVKSAPLANEPLPGVDAVAGLSVMLPAIDVMAGDPGANTLSVPVVPVVAEGGADEDPGQS